MVGGREQEARLRPAVAGLRRGRKTTQQSRGISNVNPRLNNVLGHNGPGSDDCAITDRDREYRGIRPDIYPAADLRWPPEIAVFSGRAAVNKEIVDKHGPVRNEAVVPNRYELADKRMGLNPAAFTDDNSLLNFYERSDEAIVTYFAAIKVDRLDDRNAFTKRYVNNPGLPQLRLRCDDLIQLLGRMLVTKSGPDTKVTKGRLSYCQQRFICSR